MSSTLKTVAGENNRSQAVAHPEHKPGYNHNPRDKQKSWTRPEELYKKFPVEGIASDRDWAFKKGESLTVRASVFHKVGRRGLS
jgi:hypothetical protein